MLVLATFQPLMQRIIVVGTIAFSGNPLIEWHLTHVSLVHLEQMLIRFGNVVGAIEVEDFLRRKARGK
jgi:hypothetical protein